MADELRRFFVDPTALRARNVTLTGVALSDDMSASTEKGSTAVFGMVTPFGVVKRSWICPSKSR